MRRGERKREGEGKEDRQLGFSLILNIYAFWPSSELFIGTEIDTF